MIIEPMEGSDCTGGPETCQRLSASVRLRQRPRNLAPLPTWPLLSGELPLQAPVTVQQLPAGGTRGLELSCSQNEAFLSPVSLESSSLGIANSSQHPCFLSPDKGLIPPLPSPRHEGRSRHILGLTPRGFVRA